MEIKVIRKYKKEEYTIGEMRVDGKWFSNTLEDKDRGLRDDMTLSQVKRIKVYGKTAIPYGTYEVSVYFWPKYRKKYPLLHNVKGFEGILVHGGVDHSDTLGCLLVGENRIRGKLTNCEKYVRRLTTLCEEAVSRGEKITITIE